MGVMMKNSSKASSEPKAKVIAKTVVFSKHLDICKSHFLSFTMTPLEGFTDTLEIFARYAPTPKKPGFIDAEVWVGTLDGNLRRYLFTDEFSSDESDPDDYVKIALQIHNSSIFQNELVGFLNWLNKYGQR